MQSLHKVSQQTLWQLIGKIVTSLSTFIILGLVARTYGEEGTGVFTLSITYLGIFYLLSDFGFNAHVLKEKSIQWNKLLGTRILWSIALILISIGLLPFLPFATKDFSAAVMFGSLAILASGVFVSSNLLFQSKLRYDLSVLASSIGTLVGLGAFIALSYSSLPSPTLLLAHLLSWVVIAGVSLVLIKKITPSISPVFNFSYMKTLLKDSWPIAVTLALNVVYFRADAFMISVLRSNSEVGIYNIAYSVFQTALVLPTFIMNAYYPLLLKSFKEVKKVALILLGLALAGTAVTYFLSPFIIALLTGKGFLGSIESLRILSFGFPAFFLSSLLMWVLVTKGKYKSLLIIYLIGLMVNILLNSIFIPEGSFIAASYITVFSEYLILILQAVSLIR